MTAPKRKGWRTDERGLFHKFAGDRRVVVDHIDTAVVVVVLIDTTFCGSLENAMTAETIAPTLHEACEAADAYLETGQLPEHMQPAGTARRIHAELTAKEGVKEGHRTGSINA